MLIPIILSLAFQTKPNSFWLKQNLCPPTKVCTYKMVITVLKGRAAKKAEKDFPQVASVQIHLSPRQAKLHGNEWMKPCSPDNHDDACVDATLREITNRIYIHQETCEKWEGVKCISEPYPKLSQYGCGVEDRWYPIGKVIFEDIEDDK